MAILIRKVQRTKEVDQVLNHRYQVMGEAGRVTHSIFNLVQKVSDHYDVYPSTSLYIAYSEGKVVGTVRAVQYRMEEEFFNHLYNWKESFLQNDSLTYLIDMLTISKSYANHPLLAMDLLKTLLMDLAQREVAEIYFLVPEEIQNICQEIGFRVIHPPLFVKLLGGIVVPMIISLVDFYNTFVSNIKDQEILRFQQIFYKMIFHPGEVLALEGEHGGTGYLIENGEVEVLIENKETIISVCTFSKGSLVGEIAMMTGEGRIASLVAKSLTSVLAFDRRDFLKVVYQYPQHTLDLFKIFSKRIAAANSRLANNNRKE